jgi:hypothetical protein
MTIRIVLTCLWVAAGLLSIALSFSSFFFFDAPGTESNKIIWALFYAVLSLPIWWFLGALLPWIFGRTRFGNWLFLIPIVDVVVIVALFAALQAFCGGQFACGHS